MENSGGYFRPNLPVRADAVGSIGLRRSAGSILAGLALLLHICIPAPVGAQELFLLGGIVQNSNDGKNSYSWQLEYVEGLGENLALGVTYLNEGHVPNHHRDGNALQLRTRTRLLERRLTLAAGIGPYFYYDTTPDNSGTGYQNDHGFGAIFSSSITWQTESRWLFQLRSNWVETFGNFDSFSALAGIGYNFGEPASAGPASSSAVPGGEKAKNCITLYAGQTIVNSRDSQKAVALAVEYRRRIWPLVEWTAAWLYEGDSRLTNRTGVAGELWAVRDFLDDRLSVGIGGGGYFPIDERGGLKRASFKRNVCGLLTLTSSYLVLPPWELRVSWNRVITGYNRDSDVILGGVGYRF